MLKQQSKVFLCLLGLGGLGLGFAGTSCAIPDGDLQVSGVQLFSVTPASTDVDVLSVDVSGEATLAYTSADSATVEIFVNGRSSYSGSLDASAGLALTFSATLPLLEGPNEVVANLNYNGNTLSDTFVVNVAEGVQGITLTPALDTVTGFAADVTVDTSLGFTSPEAAILDIAVNGRVVHSQSIDASSAKTASVSATIPMDNVGPNEVVATVRYQGNEMTQRSTISVAPSAATVDLPTWSTAFTQTDTVTVAIDSAWTVDEVAFSVDQSEFLPAANLGGGDFSVNLVNLDIGDSALTLRVTTSNEGHEQVQLFHSSITGILPVFNCTAPSSMLPVTELIRNNRTELRSMIGYFGDPNAGHTLTFIIDFLSNRNGNVAPYTVGGTVRSAGRTSADVEFSVDGFRCNNNPCTGMYNLRLLVDGNQVCNQSNYGVIREY